MSANDHITGIRVVSQEFLDAKANPNSESELAYLGPNNNLAFIYPRGHQFYCREEQTRYVWREPVDENEVGLLPSNFVYPAGLQPDENGFNYSSKAFNFFLQPQTLNVGTIGNGIPVYAGFNSQRHEFRSLISEDAIFELEYADGVPTGNILLRLPSSGSVQALYVDSKYVPTYDEWNKNKNGSGFFSGFGSASQPFTNTVTYTAPDAAPTIIPNSAIANGIAGYIGTGTPENPEKSGQEIQVFPGNSQYIFPGNFNQKNIRFHLIGSSMRATSSGFICDMDTSPSFNTNNETAIFKVSAGGYFEFTGQGFKNSGNDIASDNYSATKIIYIEGDEISRFENTYNAPTINRYMFSCDPDSTIGNNNAGGICIQVNANAVSITQGVYKVGGKCRLEFTKNLTSSTIVNTVEPGTKAFVQTGGFIRAFGGKMYFQGGSRVNALSIQPSITYPATFFARDCQFVGTMSNLFDIENDNQFILNMTGCTSLFFFCNKIFNTAIARPVYFNNNNFESGSIDTSLIDLTDGNNKSTFNVVGQNVYESLKKYANRTAALAAVGKNVAFINMNQIPKDFPGMPENIRDITS